MPSVQLRICVLLAMAQLSCGGESADLKEQKDCTGQYMTVSISKFDGPRNQHEVLARATAVCGLPEGKSLELNCNGNTAYALSWMQGFERYMLDESGAVIGAYRWGDVADPCANYVYGDVSSCGTPTAMSQGEVVNSLCGTPETADGAALDISQ